MALKSCPSVKRNLYLPIPVTSGCRQRLFFFSLMSPGLFLPRRGSLHWKKRLEVWNLVQTKVSTGGCYQGVWTASAYKPTLACYVHPPPWSLSPSLCYTPPGPDILLFFEPHTPKLRHVTKSARSFSFHLSAVWTEVPWRRYIYAEDPAGCLGN